MTPLLPSLSFNLRDASNTRTCVNFASTYGPWGFFFLSFFFFFFFLEWGGRGASYVAKSESAVRVLFLVWISRRSVCFISKWKVLITAVHTNSDIFFFFFFKCDLTGLCVNRYFSVSVYHFIQDQSCLPLPLSPKEKRALRMYLSVFRTSLFFVSLYVLLLLLLLN